VKRAWAAVRPALFIGGAHKAGTTALFQALAQHPGLCAHEASELTFFVEDGEHAQGFGSRAWLRHVPPEAGTRPFVAKHVKLMYRRVALERLAAAAPEVRLVLVLRDPIERARSAYWHARSHGREELPSFEAALAAEEGRLSAGRVPWHDTAYFQNGCYAGPVRTAREVLGGERVDVWFLEELRAAFETRVGELYARLGVEPDFRPDRRRGANRATRARSEPLARALARVFDSRGRWKRALRRCVPDGLAVRLRHGLLRWNTREAEAPPLLPDTVASLRARYRAPNQELAAVLGRGLPSSWNG